MFGLTSQFSHHFLALWLNHAGFRRSVPIFTIFPLSPTPRKSHVRRNTPSLATIRLIILFLSITIYPHFAIIFIWIDLARSLPIFTIWLD